VAEDMEHSLHCSDWHDLPIELYNTHETAIEPPKLSGCQGKSCG
jgi:hypothetical protein